MHPYASYAHRLYFNNFLLKTAILCETREENHFEESVIFILIANGRLLVEIKPLKEP